MSYTSVFGGNAIYPSDVSYLALNLSADTGLEWPLENAGEAPPAARIIDVTPTAGGYSVLMPDATLTGAGQTVLFNNLSTTATFTVKDYAGGTLATIGTGEQWQVYLAATTSQAGTWRVFRYGASTATVQPSALAGFGVLTTGATLSQSLPVTTFNTSGLTLSNSNRASAFVWIGVGSGVLNLPTAAGAGNNFFVFVRNEGGGDLVVDPAGSDRINSDVTLVLRPGDSATIITDGLEWFTIGLGQDPVFAFDYTSITVTGGTKTLTGSELNRIAYNFQGTLTADQYVIIPSTVQQYWITNGTTGPFNLFFKTASGVPVQINQGARGIYYCDGASLVLASDPLSITTPLVISEGGTGATTASGARLSLGITAFADPIVTATNASAVRTIIGAAASGANADISSLSGLTTALSVAQGGTGANTAAGARANFGLGTVAAQNANAVNITGGVITGITDLAVADGGTGASDAATARSNLGAAASGANTDITSLNPALGLQIGAPTGGAKGAGSINATALFINGSPVGSSSGTVSSVALSGGSTGLTVSGSPITTSGTMTLAGTLGSSNGGTGQTTYANGELLIGNSGALSKSTLTAGTGVSITNGPGTITIALAGSGTVTSVSGSGAGISVSPTSGAVVVSNTGVTSLTAGSGIALSGSTGAITISATGGGGSGTFSADDGSVSAPSVYFTNDTNTGIYRPTTDQLAIAAGGSRVGLFASGRSGLAIGQGALASQTTGVGNVAIGTYSGGVGAGGSITDGAVNTCLGETAGYAISSGGANTALGAQAMYGASNNVTGNSNTGVGYQTYVSILSSGSFSGSRTTCIGHGANPSSTTVSDEITLGHSGITALRCAVTSITALSDARDKTDVVTLDAGLAFLRALNPVRFTWNMRDPEGKHGEVDTGFIAQELKAVQEQTGVRIPGLVYDSNPERLEASYGKLLPALVKAIQELATEVDVLKARLGGRGNA